MLALTDLLDLFANKLSGLSCRGFAFALGSARFLDCGFQWHRQNRSLLAADAVPLTIDVVKI
jgi:hypothetical protein